MILSLMGSVAIAGLVGDLSERTGFTRNGTLPSIIICVGGAVLFYATRVMFRVSFGAPGLDAIISSVGALIIVPTRWKR